MNKKQVKKINVRVLVVDDDPNIRKIIKDSFDLRDFEVICVDGYIAAMEALKGNLIHVMISDIYMPGVDGFQLIKEAKTLFPKLKVIAITGNRSMPPELSLRKATQNGADKVYEKPFNLLDLLKSVNQLAASIEA